VFDTNVIIQHKMPDVPGFVSAVVLQELTAGADDSPDLRRLGWIRRFCNVRLVEPTTVFR
jgi:hypothetical protein